MSVFTMSLQEATEFNTLSDSLDVYFGLDAYPTPDGFEATPFRTTLNKKIIEHYWNREIGLESFSMWRYNIRRKMNEIMPYFNKLYKSELIAFDPLSTMNMRTTSSSTQESDSTGTSDSEADSTARSKAVSSDYPQTQFNQNNTGNYGTTGNDSLAESENKAKANDVRNEKGKADAETSSQGYAGSAAALLTEYRSTLLNIDMMVIDGLEECFMQVLGTGDTFTGNGYFV